MRMHSILFTLLIVSVPVFTQAPERKHDPNLTILDWLAHGTWTASPKGPDGKTTLIESKIRWAETGTAIHFESSFDRKPQYYGLYAYDPDRKQIRFFYASADGEFSEGQISGDAKTLRQSFTVSSANGTVQYHSTITRDGENAYDFNVYAGTSQTPVVTVHYERADPGKRRNMI